MPHDGDIPILLLAKNRAGRQHYPSRNVQQQSGPSGQIVSG